MKKLFLLTAIFSASIAYSQIWYFGGRCGLDFNSGSPVVINDCQMTAAEGCITVNDASGNFLFYSNGDSIWDRNHNWISTSVGAGAGGYSGSQNTLAIRKPGDPNLYYIFYQAAQGDPNGFRYREFDMTMNLGFGDLTQNGAQLLSQSCEQMTAVRHSNGIDVWVIVHGLNSNSFYAYLVNGAGVSSTPVISSVGTTINSSFNMVETIGCMKISCDGMHLAITHYGDSITELFSFDRTSGSISNPQVLSTTYAPYGLEFSINSNYLYVSEWISNGASVYQYDMSAGNIAASQTIVGTVPSSLGSAGQLQMGPDHKIYIAVLYSDSLSIIQNPDAGGLACNFTANGIHLGNGISLYGLPNTITGLYCSPPNPDAISEANTKNTFFVFPNPAREFIMLETAGISGEYSVSIVNSTGQTVYSVKSNQEILRIDLNSFVNGVYIVRLASEDQTFVRKLILE